MKRSVKTLKNGSIKADLYQDSGVAGSYANILKEVRDYAVLMLDRDGKILTWNAGTECIKGYTEEEIIGKNFRIFYCLEEIDSKLPENLLNQAADKVQSKHEGWLVRKDGTKFWAAVLITAIYDAHKNIIGFSTLTRDLSEERATVEQYPHYVRDLQLKNEELRRSEERYHKMISEVEDYAILLLDPSGYIRNWNKGAEKIKGYPPYEAIGKNFSIFYLPVDIARGLPGQLLNQARNFGKATHEGWRVRKDGNVFWGSIVITALYSESKDIIGFSKVTRDLSERHLAEELLQRQTKELKDSYEQLSQNEERYHRMIAEVEDYAIILLDINGNIKNWNRGAAKIKGYTEAEILGKNFSIFYLAEDREANFPQQLLRKAVQNNKATHEGWRVRKDGSRFWGSIVITALHGEANEIIGFVKVTRDLTQKKEYEDQILAKNRQLEEFAFIASHDLQEPLRKIQLYNSRMISSLGNDVQLALYIEKIGTAASRMSNLITDVLRYSQLQNSANLFKLIKLGEVVQNVNSDFELLLHERNGVIICEELPEIVAIPIQMQQLIGNLVSNAIKFNDKNPVIHIASDIFLHENGRFYIKLILSDNGNGLDMKYADRIFQMFQRADSASRGTGIGLALCKKIAENHGGSISVSSTLGLGSVFEVDLPLEGPVNSQFAIA